MSNTKTYRGLKYTLATAETGAVCLNVYDDNTKSYVFASSICKDKQQLIQLIKDTKEYYNDILNKCYEEVCRAC